jgi:hypothetical protein
MVKALGCMGFVTVLFPVVVVGNFLVMGSIPFLLMHPNHSNDCDLGFKKNPKSISNGALYVILHNKIGHPKVCGFGSGKWFWLHMIVLRFAVAGE